MLFLSIQDFITQYFVGPIENPAIYGNYNIFSTLVYAAILLVAGFLVIYPFFAKRGVKFGYKFALALLPYIVLGSSFRILEDLQWTGRIAVGLLERSANPLQLGYYLVSPGIYILVGVLAIVALYACLKLFKQNYLKPFALVGIICALPFLIFDLLNLKNFLGFFLVLVLFAVVFVLVVFGFKALKKKLLEDKLNKLAFAGQLLDGTATFVAIGFFGFQEQHLASNALIEFSPVLFPIAKIIVVLAILYYIDKALEKEQLKGFAKLFVLIIGFAPGIRDLLSLGVLGTA